MSIVPSIKLTARDLPDLDFVPAAVRSARTVERQCFCALLVVVGVLGQSVQAEQNTSNIDISRRGPQIGRPVTANRITTDHLQITTYASDAAVAPGAWFSIVFDISPRERMHVYAPGAKDYKIISVILEPNPLLVTRPVQYPSSEIYFFEPLNERVPVFQKPFRLTQSVAVSTAPEQRATLAKVDRVTIKGTLDYQACDDRLCFAPKSIPVSYTVRLRPLDTERAGAAR